jgi:hypothetical protein
LNNNLSLCIGFKDLILNGSESELKTTNQIHQTASSRCLQKPDSL